MKLNTQTQLCGVIGNPVAHSLSPAIHNAAFEALQLNYVYLAFRVENIQDALQGFRAMGNIRGFSVTIPHKVSAMPYLDEVDPVANHIGAINTIVKENAHLKGSNTDAAGALRALREAGVNLPDETITILGSGGAARAIAFGLAMEGGVTSLTLLGIDETERLQLAKDLQERTGITVQTGSVSREDLRNTIENTSLLLHCTPMGMHPNLDDTCVPQDLLHSKLTVMDIVYNPLHTRLLREARRTGCRTIQGTEMFLYQAVAQFELWTGHQAPVTLMRTILESHFS